MKAKEFAKPNVPITYVLLTLEQAAERGVTRDKLLENLDISSAMLEQSDARIPLLQYGHIVARALRLTGDQGLGLDFGLRTGLTAHGLLGLGMMSQRTLRDVIEFARKYLVQLRSPGFTTRFFIEESQGVIDVREAVPYGPLRQYAFDMLLVSLVQAVRQLLTQEELELWFECPEPEYYKRYRDRLPPVRYSMGANQLRFPAKQLDRPLETANAATAQMVSKQCDREIMLLGHTEDILARVRALLINEQGHYPDQETMAARLFMSSRTFKRRLSEHGFSFQQLLDEARRRDSIRLLEDTTLSVEDIATRIGYTAHGNFIRAFRKWTGKTPSAFRTQPESPPRKQ